MCWNVGTTSAHHINRQGSDKVLAAAEDDDAPPLEPMPSFNTGVAPATSEVQLTYGHGKQKVCCWGVGARGHWVHMCQHANAHAQA